MRSLVWQDEVRWQENGTGWARASNCILALGPVNLGNNSTYSFTFQFFSSLRRIRAFFLMCVHCSFPVCLLQEHSGVCSLTGRAQPRLFYPSLLPCPSLSGSLFHLPLNSFLRRWNGAGCSQIQGAKKRSSEVHGLVPISVEFYKFALSGEQGPCLRVMLQSGQLWSQTLLQTSSTFY